MKKGLIFLLGIISFFGINKVSAATDFIEISNFFDYFEEYVEDYNTYKENIEYMVDYWEQNYSSEYPYYVIVDSLNGSYASSNGPTFILYASIDNNISYSSSSRYFEYNAQYNSDGYVAIEYDTTSMSYKTDNIFTVPIVFYTYNNTMNNVKKHAIISNSVLRYVGSQNFLINSYYSDNFNFSQVEIKNGDSFPTIISLHEGSYDVSTPITDTYKEINLNDYSYVILSLKDYTPRDTFTSTMYVKGQLCPTTVYNYGLEEKKDYISGYQTQPCSYYYNNYTSFISYIKSEDILNHAIYYLTSYDSSKPNLVKVDSSVYDITYITSENEKEPYVSIEGKNYPVLPYSDLTDTAELTEKNGIDNTWTCAKYDTNCILNSSGIDIDNLFSQPLETLKTVWETIKTIFTLITEFISLLPPIMQGFLMLAFGTIVVLGIIKVIL